MPEQRCVMIDVARLALMRRHLTQETEITRIGDFALPRGTRARDAPFMVQYLLRVAADVIIALQIMKFLERRHPEIRMALKLIVEPRCPGLVHADAEKIRAEGEGHARKSGVARAKHHIARTSCKAAFHVP